jgi:hypothetical protein
MKKNLSFIFLHCTFLISFFFVLTAVAQKIEIKNDAKIIHNKKPLWGNTPKVRLEFVKKIGELEGDDENYLFACPNDVFRDANGNLYICDFINHHVKKFNREGTFISTLGRNGQGPGEFVFPRQVDMDNKGNLYICHNGGLEIINNEGVYINGFKTGNYFRQFRILNSQEIIACDFLSSFYWFRKGVKTHLFKILDFKGEVQREFGEIKEYKNINFTSLGNSISFNVDKDKYIYVTYLFQNKIEKYTPEGQLIFIAKRPLNYKLTQEMVTEKKTSRSLGTTKVFNVPKMPKVSEAIAIDGKNRIWIITYNKHFTGNKKESEKYSDLCVYEIFNEKGILLGKLPFGSVSPYKSELRIFDDRLYLVDRLQEVCIYEYKIVEIK